MDVQCSAKELVAVLSKSSIATVLVEGSDDMQVYRWIEDAIPGGVDVLSTGGRGNLLEIYKERAKFDIPIAFVADRDLWSFTSCPSEYSDVIFTTGFSIENDVLLDSSIEKLFSKEEVDTLNGCIKELANWYAYEVEEYLNGRPYKISNDPRELLPRSSLTFDVAVIQPQVYRVPSAGLVKTIIEDFRVKFRGKNLLSLYNYLFEMRRSGSPKYSKGALLEMATKIAMTHTKQLLVDSIKEALVKTGFVFV